jgi:hypothetical protein
MTTKTNFSFARAATIIVLALSAVFFSLFFAAKNSSANSNLNDIPFDYTYLSTGDGSQEQPYLISNGNQLAAALDGGLHILPYPVSFNNTSHIKLIDDIDLSGYLWNRYRSSTTTEFDNFGPGMELQKTFTVDITIYKEGKTVDLQKTIIPTFNGGYRWIYYIKFSRVQNVYFDTQNSSDYPDVREFVIAQPCRMKALWSWKQ